MIGQEFGFGQRLSEPADYAATLRRGRFVRGRYVIAYALPNGRGSPRLGLVIGKRAVPLSVTRSFMKRRIREVFRMQQDLLGGNDVVVRAIGEVGAEQKKEFVREVVAAIFEACQWQNSRFS